MRFFFDFTDGVYETKDHEGHECASSDAARREALQSLPEVMLSNPKDADAREVICNVRGEDGTVLYRASISLRSQRSPNH